MFSSMGIDVGMRENGRCRNLSEGATPYGRGKASRTGGPHPPSGAQQACYLRKYEGGPFVYAHVRRASRYSVGERCHASATPLSQPVPLLIRYDVIVIGGGLAGCSAAAQLARRGHDVLLFEKATYPRHKLCGDFLSPEVQASLQTLEVLDEVSGPAACLHC